MDSDLETAVSQALGAAWRAVARMAEEAAGGTVTIDVSPEGVAKRVDGVIDDCLNDRLTPPQKASVRSAIDRSDRVNPESDKAIGRILGG